MKLKFSKLLLVSLLALPAYAGQMSGVVGYQVYRDFALNQGAFEVGATDVPIYNQATGDLIGTIPLVPDLGATVSPFAGAKGGSLAGGKQSWVSSTGHVGDQGQVRFMDDMSLNSSSPFFENYDIVETFYLGASGGFYTDFTISRTAKVVTDAVGWNYAETLTSTDLRESVIVRSGFGQQSVVPAEGGANQVIANSTQNLTAGIVDYTYSFSSFVTATLPDGTSGSFRATRVYMTQSAPDSGNPLPIGALLGDSGSGAIYYDKDLGEWLFIGQLTSADLASTGYSTTMSSLYSAQWAESVQDCFKVYFSDDTVSSYKISRNDSTGVLTFSSDNDLSYSVQALANGLRGDTSTEGTRASDVQMNAAKDWVLSESVDLVIHSDINTGAGVLYFHTQADGAANEYHLSAAQTDYQLNSAGYLIQENVTLRSELTGAAGDEWRVVGDTGEGGTFIIQGYGSNQADLNLGVGVHVVLDRDGGYAAHDVKISTQASVALRQNEAFSGSLTFGQDGGVLDLAGNTQSISELNSYDDNALIINTQGTANLHITADVTAFHGSFIDSQKAEMGDAVMHVNYQGTTSSSSLTLSSTNAIAGNFHVTGAQLVLDGDKSHLHTRNLGIYQGAGLKLTAGSTLTGNLHIAGELTVEGSHTLNHVYLYQGHEISFADAESSLQLNHVTLFADSELIGQQQLVLSGEITVMNVSVCVSDMDQYEQNVRSALRSTGQVLTLETGLDNAHIIEGSNLDLVLSQQVLSYMQDLGGDISSITIEGISADSYVDTVSISVLMDDNSIYSTEEWQGMSWAGASGGIDISGKNLSALQFSVPEPSTAVMSILALMGLLSHRRRS